MGVGLGCCAEPEQGGLVRPVAKICFMLRPLYALYDRVCHITSIKGALCDRIGLFRRDLSPSALTIGSIALHKVQFGSIVLQNDLRCNIL